MELKLELDSARMPVAVAFTESAAQSAGFEKRERSLLVLAVEELFLALCKVMPGSNIELGFRDRCYAAELCFSFFQPPPDLRIFNITSIPDHHSEAGMDDLGLFLASRICDQFSVQQMPQGNWVIRLIKERNYPATPSDQKEPDAAIITDAVKSDSSILSGHTVIDQQIGSWNILSTPGPDSVKQLSDLINRRYSATQFPENFSPPGRLLDKLASNDYGVILAQGEHGVTVGGLIWRSTDRRIVECFGPYHNNPLEPELLTDTLCEKLCQQFGRSRYLGIVLYSPQAPTPGAGFEPAGCVETAGTMIWTGYRMLNEEFGAVAYLPSELLSFYHHWISSMALSREICEYRDNGEGADGLTLFGTLLNRSAGMALLTPLMVGRDAAQVIQEHLQLLDNEGYTAICCQLDTGRPFDSLLGSHLLANGFVPRVLVPWGGHGDLLHLYRYRSSR